MSRKLQSSQDRYCKLVYKCVFFRLSSMHLLMCPSIHDKCNITCGENVRLIHQSWGFFSGWYLICSADLRSSTPSILSLSTFLHLSLRSGQKFPLFSLIILILLSSQSFSVHEEHQIRVWTQRISQKHSTIPSISLQWH